MAIRNYFLSLILAGISLCCYNVEAACNNNSTCRYKLNKSDSTYIGVIVPLFTPFKNNTCEVNLDIICNDVQYFSQKGVDGFMLASKTGEGFSLSTKETMAVYKTCVQKIKKTGKKIYVQVGTPTLDAQILARYAESLGVDGIFTVMSTYVNRAIQSPELITKGIKSIADCAPNTLVYFAADQLTAIGLNVSYYQIFKYCIELIKNFGGMSLGQEYADQLRASGIVNPQKQALIVRSHYSYRSASYFGINGIVSVATTLFPGLAVEAWYAKSEEQACISQEKINKNIRAIASPYSYISATKTTYSLLSGIYQGEVRAPEVRASCEQKKKIATNLQELGYKLKGNVTCTDVKEGNQCVVCSCSTA